MQSNVIHLPVGRSRVRTHASPAEQYEFTGDPAQADGSPMFVAQAAAFQAIRDCLAAADRREMSRQEAERKIRVYLRAYFDAGLC